jgi:glycosyltransferase involved in cell wall biosynthesis
MNITYDISVLGLAHFHLRARTGIFRVVEAVAYGLKESKECEVSFCATAVPHSIDDSLAYLKANARLSDVPLPHPKLSRKISQKIQNLNVAIEEAVRLQKLPLKLVRKFLLYADKLVGPYKPIDRRTLARSDIFHSPYFAIPEQAREARHLKRFLTVYDLIPILYPQYCETGVEELAKEILKSLTPEDNVICISQATKNDFCNYRSEFDPARVYVTYLAASDFFYPCFEPERLASVRDKYAIPRAPYLLSLSTLEPRKNIDHTIHSFARLVQEQNIGDLHLVLTGTKGWKYEEIFKMLSSCKAVKDRIILTGFVADEDLAALYSGALGFVYPSFYEGFGLPPLEAMQCGVPVITSNTSSLPEIVGEAGIMVDPTDVDGLCQSMLSLYESQSLRESMSLKSLEQSKKFSWERCVQQTITAYKKSLLN